MLTNAHVRAYTDVHTYACTHAHTRTYTYMHKHTHKAHTKSTRLQDICHVEVGREIEHAPFLAIVFAHHDATPLALTLSE